MRLASIATVRNTISEPAKALKTTPVRSRLCAGARPLDPAIQYRSAVAPSAPAKANAGTVTGPSAAPSTSASTPPSVAPPEMPRMYGSASGL